MYMSQDSDPAASPEAMVMVYEGGAGKQGFPTRPPLWVWVCLAVPPPPCWCGWVPLPQTNWVLNRGGGFPLDRQGFHLRRTSSGVFTLQKNVVFVPQGR